MSAGERKPDPFWITVLRWPSDLSLAVLTLAETGNIRRPAGRGRDGGVGKMY
jgi:hypothetical protein